MSVCYVCVLIFQLLGRGNLEQLAAIVTVDLILFA